MRDLMARLHLMGERSGPLFVRGQGSWLWDAEGRAFLDFDQDQGANSFGHSPSLLLAALHRQAELLISPGRGQCSRGQLKLAAQLCQAVGSERVTFCSDARQAAALAVRLALHWASEQNPEADSLVLVEGNSFGPLPETVAGRVLKVSFNDLDALAAALDSRCAAVLIEPVQQAAGVVPATLEYLQGAQRLCREQGAVLILDEAGSGMGRCGTLLAEELYGVRADLLILGNGLAGGLPLAALLARGRIASQSDAELAPRFSGEALLAAAGVAVLNSVLEGSFLAQVREVAGHLREGLAHLARCHGHGPLRGHGLLVGLPLIGQSAATVQRAACEQGLLIGIARDDCLRLTPALTVSHGNVEEMLRRLGRALQSVENNHVEVA
ncbi:aspartate aminotransferase family protein [Pseudomonas sp. NCCP-436]|uniref:aspartate aminotransferase family protein n=1 Tax=Pseudomonas sp. NCCP-436 TaxID=2842481 RepID=UPI001C7EF209|nr:aminotransferase class III-fold pyridoxal phosphate-dependent enzyme [Pseudomonas sp. NCCP-436]GIZ12678.1 class III pyridoxal phosphate-dependent aminotransferase [Pseudomonas sp. NCCP-436]